MLLNLAHLLFDDVLSCGGGGLSGILSRLSGNFGGIFLLSFVLLSLFSSFLLELLEFIDLLFDFCCLLVGLVLGMGGSLSSLFLDLGGLDCGGLRVLLLLLFALMAMALLFAGRLFKDLCLCLVLCLLDGVNLRVLSMDKLIMLGLSSLLSLGLGRLGVLLLLLKLLDASIHLLIVLSLDLLIMGSLFLVFDVCLVLSFLDFLMGVFFVVLRLRLVLLLLDDGFGGLLVGTAAATELLLNMLDDGVMMAGQSLGIDTVKVLMGDLILELGLDLGLDTLNDLACGDFLAFGGLLAAVRFFMLGGRRGAGSV